MGNDWTLRLYRSDNKPHYEGSPHDRIVNIKNTSKINGIINHYSFRSIEHHLIKANKYYYKLYVVLYKRIHICHMVIFTFLIIKNEN